MNKDIEIITIKALSDNYIWLLRNHSKKLTAVVDPAEAEPVEEILLKNNWELNQIINTHHHYDHTNGNLKLKEKYSAVLIAPKLEQDKIQNIDHSVEDGDTIDIAGLPAKIIHTPGHTIGHMAFYCKKLSAVFTGDSLMALGCGRLFEGTAFQMLRSLKKISSLPNETMVYSGHEYALNNGKFALSLEPNNQSLAERVEKIKNNLKANRPNVPVSLQEEKKTNPFLRYNVPTLKQMLMMDNNSEEEIFAALRNMKDNF